MALDHPQPETGPQQPISVAILQRHELDCEALGTLLREKSSYRIVGATTSLKGLVTLCHRFGPDVALVDAKFPTQYGDVVHQSAALISAGKVRSILFLDELPNNLRACQAVSLGWAGYITRRSSVAQLLKAIDRLVECSPIGSGPGDREPQNGAVPPLEPPIADSPLRELTTRELDVFNLLAQGLSARECAAILRLSVSTIDNHRSRIMRKLGISKTVQMTLLAVRERLISP